MTLSQLVPASPVVIFRWPGQCKILDQITNLMETCRVRCAHHCEPRHKRLSIDEIGGSFKVYCLVRIAHPTTTISNYKNYFKHYRILKKSRNYCSV
jgi:hypothetical protein